MDRVSEATLPYYEAIAAKARTCKVNHLEDTSRHQHGVLMWLWVIVKSTVVFFSVMARSSRAAFEELIRHWAGFLVSDDYAVYRRWANMRQTCLVHPIRTAEGLAGRKDPPVRWLGQRIRSELQRLSHWEKAPPTKGEVSAWCARMCHLITSFKHRKDEAGKLARLLEAEVGTFGVFLIEDGADPTNNRPERVPRFAVLWRRMMQGSFNEKGINGLSGAFP